jgi:hypothetical protein
LLSHSQSLSALEKGEQKARAVGVPLFYGAIEALLVGGACVAAWKAGWTCVARSRCFFSFVFSSSSSLARTG